MKNNTTLYLKNLNCAHCASVIETEINQLDDVSFASLNFVNKSISIEFNSGFSLASSLDKIKAIVSKIEPDVIVDTASVNDEEKSNDKMSILKIGIGALIFGLASLTKITPLFFIAYFILGYDILLKSLKNIIKGKIFDENFLMSLATIGAIFIKQYPEAVAIMLFYQIGEYLQEKAVGKSRKAIKSLLNIKPEYAIRENGEKTSPESIAIDEIILVKAGEKVPLDGIVVEGEAFLDMSALIGESVPKKVMRDCEVLSGSINTNGFLKIKVTKEYTNSTIAKILDLVENSSAQKSKTENFISKFAKVYTPIVVICAVLLAVIPPLFSENGFAFWLQKSLIFLVSSCPCALIVSVPLSFFSGIGTASKNGILIKGSVFIQNLANTNSIIFDKTGTLTKGVFKVKEICLDTNDTLDLLNSIYNIEKYSIHPIAKSIVDYCKENISFSDLKVDNFVEMSGLGLKASINGNLFVIGNKTLLSSCGIDVCDVDKVGSIVHIAKENKYLGYIIVSDIIKENSKSIISNLKNLGIQKTTMLSGDKKETALYVANEIGIDDAYYELLPQDKVEMFKKIKKDNKNVCFVGDGINDAPVLSLADTGISMGGVGSDIAIEASDIVIMNDDLSKICDAIKISKKTMSIVKSNIFLALAIKFAVLIWAIIGNAPIWVAVFADVGVSVIAVLNSMRKKL